MSRSKKKQRQQGVVVALGRDELAERAQAFANYAAKRLPAGARVVVAVTDVEGDWVGVGSNTNPHDVEAILRSSLIGADKCSAPRSIIEVRGEEA